MTWQMDILSGWLLLEAKGRIKGIPRSRTYEWTRLLARVTATELNKVGRRAMGWWVKWIALRVAPPILADIADVGIRALTGKRPRKRKVPLLVGLLLSLFVPAKIMAWGALGWAVVQGIATATAKVKG